MVEKLKLEIQRLRKIIKHKNRTDGVDTSSPTYLIKQNFRTYFKFIRNDKIGERSKCYIFKFKTPKVHDFLFAREKGMFYQYDELKDYEKKALDLYIKNSSDKESRVVFYHNREDHFLSCDFLKPFESSKDVISELRKIIEDSPGNINDSGLRVIFVLLSACCRRLFNISFGIKKRRYDIQLMTSKLQKNEYIKSLMIEKNLLDFEKLTATDQTVFLEAKGLLYSTLFLIPDDNDVLENCITKFFWMLEILGNMLNK